MNWITFIYAGEYRQGFVLEESDINGNKLVYQTAPTTGIRSFAPDKMYGESDLESPWTFDRKPSSLYSTNEICILFTIIAACILGAL